MDHQVKDSFLDLERHRQLLEDNIAKLRKSLQHWQTWEAEYEGLKEEILASEPLPDREQLVAIGRQYEADLVTGKQVDELLGNSSRTAPQVVNLLDRRIDYVDQNVRTIQKQITTAEEKLAAATIISTPDVRNEEGLPLTEITEELDDEDNVVSSHTSTPGSAKPQLLEVLRKAGVKDLPESLISVGDSTQKSSKVSRKSVTFAEDTKSGPEPTKSETTKRIEVIQNLAKQADSRPTEPPIIPDNESEDDAALRREMLQYGMSEVGAVVAELDLEDGDDWSDDDYDYDDSLSTDDEDSYGRSTGKIVDDELRQQMIELEGRLGARMMENIGKKTDDYDVVQEGIGRISIKKSSESEKNARLEPPDSTDSTSSKAKKSVSFSEELDISPAPEPAPPLTMVEKPRLAAPVGDIVERVASNSASTFESVTKKPSRFKATRASAASLPFMPADERIRTVPTGPEGMTMSSDIVERDVPLDISAPGPDELDPQLMAQEVVTEYHKMRNKMILRQGGFTKEDDSEIIPFTEEEGGPKKMSRFKAARLART